jgi:hypothetical protein
MRMLHWAALVAALAGCADRASDEATRPGRIDRAYVAANLLEAPPASLGHAIGATFQSPGGGRVVYLGNDLATPRVAPGGKVAITHYWHVVEAPGPGWRVFTHLLGEGGHFVNADETDLRKGHPVAAWKTGEVIRDEQTFAVRQDWQVPRAQLVVGFYQPRKHRIVDRMAVAGGEVVDRALVVATLEIDLSRAPPPPGTLILPRAVGPITIDGRDDDPGWQRAAVQPAFAAAEGCPLTQATRAKMTWDDEHLYLFVSAEDNDVYSPYTRRDDPLWEHDVIEIFIDADGNRRGYVELQVNPHNAQFDTWIPGTRPHRDDSFDAGMQSAVVVRGTLDERGDGDLGWDVELAIPLAAARGKDPGMQIHVPPRLGDTWRLNVVRGDKARDGKARVSSWNRITCADWHALDRMLTVRFADAEGRTTPAPAEPGEPGEPAGEPAGAAGEAPAAAPPAAAADELPPPPPRLRPAPRPARAVPTEP